MTATSSFWTWCRRGLASRSVITVKPSGSRGSRRGSEAGPVTWRNARAVMHFARCIKHPRSLADDAGPAAPWSGVGSLGREKRCVKIRKVAVYKLRLTKLDWHGNRVRILNYGLHLGYEYPSVPMPTRLVGPGFAVLPDWPSGVH